MSATRGASEERRRERQQRRARLAARRGNNTAAAALISAVTPSASQQEDSALRQVTVKGEGGPASLLRIASFEWLPGLICLLTVELLTLALFVEGPSSVARVLLPLALLLIAVKGAQEGRRTLALCLLACLIGAGVAISVGGTFAMVVDTPAGAAAGGRDAALVQLVDHDLTPRLMRRMSWTTAWRDIYTALSLRLVPADAHAAPNPVEAAAQPSAMATEVSVAWHLVAVSIASSFLLWTLVVSLANCGVVRRRKVNSQ